MKKKIFKMVIGTTIAIVATVGVSLKLNQQDSEINILMKNVEALASDSESSRPKCTGPKSSIEPYICKCQNTESCRDLYGCK